MVDALNLPKRGRVDPGHGPVVMLRPALLALQVVILGGVLCLLSLLPQTQELELCVLPLVSEVGVKLFDPLFPLADLALELLKVGLKFRLQVVLHALPPLLFLVLKIPLVREPQLWAEALGEFEARALRKETRFADKIG